MNASALHAANISFLFPFAFKGFFVFATAVLGVTCNNTIHHNTRHSRKARAREKKVLFFCCPPPSLSFLHVMTNPTQPNPNHHMYSHIPSHRVSPIGSC